MVLGAVSIAEHVHRVAERYPIYVALHTDHCQADKLDKFVIPLVEETERRRAAGRPNLFNSHMFDGSALPLEGEPRHRGEAARAVPQERPHPRDRGRRGGRGGGRRQGERRGEALHDARGHARGRAAAERGRGRALSARRDLRQRARRLQARPRQAQALHPEGLPGRRREASTARRRASTSSSTAARAPTCATSTRPSTTASSR